MPRLVGLTLLISCLALVSCREDDTGTDAGADTGTDTGPADTTPPADAMEGEVPPHVSAALRALAEGVGTSAALAGPLLAESEMLRDDARADMPGATRDTAVRERIENAVSGDSIVTDPACATFDWMLVGLVVTVTFTDCIMEGTGETLSGVVSADINFGPTELIITFDSLMVGGIGFDGFVGLRVGGACGDADPDCTTCPDGDAECAEMQMNQQTLWANISFDLGEAVSMTLSDITVAHDAAGTTVDGTGTVVSPSFDGSFTLTSVNWATMACLPSSGGVLYQPTAGAAATIDLLPTTPDDGIVDVTIAPFPAFPYMLFDPCPPMP